MRLDDIVPLHPRHPLQRINILRKHTQQHPPVLQQPHKRMRQRRLVRTRIQRLRQRVKRLWVLPKVLQRKDGFGVGQLEGLEVGIQACAGGAKVGDAAVCADARADAEDHVFGAAGLDEAAGLATAKWVLLLCEAVDVLGGEDFCHFVFGGAREGDAHQRSLLALALALFGHPLRNW
jgi:hypothetical protein